MNTKKGWVPLSMHTHLCEVKTQSTKKNADRKQNQGITKPREGKTWNHPAKENTYKRLPAMTRAQNWQKLSPRRHLVQNPAKNRINNNIATPDDTKPPKDTNQTTEPREWKRLKTIPKSRDELKYRVEKYVRHIEGEERILENLKAVANDYLKQESTDSYSCHNHKE